MKVVEIVVVMNVEDDDDGEVVAQTISNMLDVSIFDWELLEVTATGERIIGEDE